MSVKIISWLHIYSKNNDFHLIAITASLCLLLFSNSHTIDVIIPCTSKDKRTLELCIEGIQKNGKNINRIIVISDKKLTDNAEWFDEKKYPFSRIDIATYIFKDKQKTKNYLTKRKNRIGWIFQQLLKLYALFVVPDISDDILVLDADTIFLRPITFIDEDGTALYGIGSEYHMPYFEHGKKLIPGFKRVIESVSGICHHMLFQRSVLQDLFTVVEQHHKEKFWQAFCNCIDLKNLAGSCASEYELYFNFIFDNQYPVKIRKLRWSNIRFSNFNKKKKEPYDYLSCHTYL
ncbi:hypothetical protein KC460_05120 [Candidatus Dependentiae bacterium]|nr:hypothetical protein [Candidatus Dependentiae bacterium]